MCFDITGCLIIGYIILAGGIYWSLKISQLESFVHHWTKKQEVIALFFGGPVAWLYPLLALVATGFRHLWTWAGKK